MIPIDSLLYSLSGLPKLFPVNAHIENDNALVLPTPKEMKGATCSY